MNIPINAQDNNFENFLFYDIEVFAFDTLVVFKTIDKKTVKVFHNDFEGLEEFITDKVLVGYNNYHYDDLILSALILKKPQYRIKGINDEIIRDEKPQIQLHDSITSLDCFQQISTAKPSLKKVEANLGLSIDESSVPFDVDRVLTESEYQDVLQYCEHDVEATIDVFSLRWNTYFVPKLSVVEMMENKSDKTIRWNTTTITANLLTEKFDRNRNCYLNESVPKWYNYKIPDEKRITEILGEYTKPIIEMWESNRKDIMVNKKLSGNKQISIESLGCKFEFGFGGLHGVNIGRSHFTNVKLMDVASMYPSIIINLEALGDTATSKYCEIVEKRLKAKKNNDKQTANALKLVINSTYGLMKNQYSKVNNPVAATSICIWGQLALYDLSKRLYEEGFTIINVNTDGVAFCGNRPDSLYQKIKSEWEKDYNLVLEVDYYRKWCQKDVNNYIAETKDGYVKVKGDDVKKFHNPLEYSGDLLEMVINDPTPSWCTTNSLGIIALSVVDYVLNGVQPELTVKRYLKYPILYQFVLQAGRTYQGTYDQFGNQYQKVNRAFAGKENGVTLSKVYPDGRRTKFENAPEDMYVHNDDLSKIENFEDKIDLQYYMKLARSTCDRWKNLNLK